MTGAKTKLGNALKYIILFSFIFFGSVCIANQTDWHCVQYENAETLDCQDEAEYEYIIPEKMECSYILDQNKEPLEDLMCVSKSFNPDNLIDEHNVKYPDVYPSEELCIDITDSEYFDDPSSISQSLICQNPYGGIYHE